MKKVLFCFIVFLGLNASPAMSGEEELTLAVHPYLSVSEIETRFTPLAEYLGKSLDRPVVIRVGGDYQEHIEAIGKDRVDIAFLGPVSYTEVTRQYDRKPLLARFQVHGEPYLYGVIATRKESDLRSLADVADKRLALVAAQSTMGHIVPRHMLIEAGLTQGLTSYYRYLGSHHNVAMGILIGEYDAGAMKKEVFDQFESKGLRALAVSQGVPDHLFVTRSDMSQQDVERLRTAMLQLDKQPGGDKIMQQLHQGLTALVAATDEEYDGLRSMIEAVERADK